MELKEIVAISGIGGLHKIIGHRPNGLIVESLDDKQNRFPTTINQKISILEDIAVFTTGGEVRLREVFLAMDTNKGTHKVPDLKADPKAMRTYFKSVLPDFDEERVYNSDIKKIISWYQVLDGKIDFSKVEEESKEEHSQEDHSGKEKKSDSSKRKQPDTASRKIASKPAGQTGGSSIRTKTTTRKSGGA